MTELRGKKVIFLFQEFLPGGAERQIASLAIALRQEGVETEVWGHRGEDPFGLRAELEDAGVPSRSVEPMIYGRAFRYGPRLLRLWAALRGAHPHAIVGVMTGPGVSVGLVWRLAGARVGVWLQQDEGLWRLPRYQERIAGRLVSKFVAVSAVTGAVVKDLYAGSRSVQIIPNAYWPPTSQAPRDWRAVIGDRVACVMVANLTSNKDHATLLEAWALTGQAVGAGAAVLLLAGYPGDTADAVNRQIAELDLANSVIVVGQIPDVPGLLEAAHVGVLSSRSEGLSVAVIAYMAHGLPVAGTDIPGIRGVLGEDAKTLTPAGDAAALAAVLTRLITDDIVRRAAAKHSVARSSLFAASTVVARWREVLA